MKQIIGIDLGTTNSCVSVMQGSRPIIIANENGSKITPSVIRYLKNEEIIVGEKADRARLLDPKNTITGIKRLIGRRYNEVMDLVPILPYKVVLGNNNLAVVDINNVHHTPQSISAIIIQYLKQVAESFLGEKVEEAIITIPAYFTEVQSQATKEAAKIAGLHVDRVIIEPTAAALAYRLWDTADRKIAVFDLGGGTFDISILETGEGVFEVKSINGDGFLGGDDFDYRIIGWLVEEIKQIHKIDFSHDSIAIERIREAAIRAKIDLTQLHEADIYIPFLSSKDKNTVNIKLSLTRQRFEDLCDELFQRLYSPCQQALKQSGLQVGDIDIVLLVGGAARMPKISQIAEEIFGVKPKKSINPEEAVALGAAIQGGVLTGMTKDVLLLDATPHTLSIGTKGGIATKLIEKGTTIPTIKSIIFTTMYDYQKSVEINILQGDNLKVEENRSLGALVLDDIARAPRGIPQIEVTIDIDANRTVRIEAKDLSSGKSTKMLLQASSGIEKGEIDTLTFKTMEYLKRDREKKEGQSYRNEMESMIFQIENKMEKLADKYPQKKVADIHGTIQSAKDIVKNKKVDELFNNVEFTITFQKLFEIISNLK